MVSRVNRVEGVSLGSLRRIPESIHEKHNFLDKNPFATLSPTAQSRLMKPGLNRQTRVALSLRTRMQFIISVRSNCKAGHLCFNTVFNSVLFFVITLTHAHISHHEDSSRQGQCGL